MGRKPTGMPVGKPRKTDEEKQEENRRYFQHLQPFLQLGCPLETAVRHANEKIRKLNEQVVNKENHEKSMSKSLVYERIQEDAEFSGRIEAEQETLEMIARQSWGKKIQDGDYIASRDYLRAKKKDEFSEKRENHNSFEQIETDPEMDEKARQAINENI